MAVCLFFTAKNQATAAEVSAIARLRARGLYTVYVRSAEVAANVLYGTKIEPCDAVAGTPPASYTGAPASKPDVTLPVTESGEDFDVYPPTMSLGAGETGQARAISADLNETTGAITTTDRTTTVAWSSSDEAAATVGAATGVITRVAAGTATITATYTAKAAVKASKDLSTHALGKYDATLEAHTAGVAANGYVVSLVDDATSSVTCTVDTENKTLVIHYKSGTSTVANVNTAIDALTSGDDVIDVKSGSEGTTARVLGTDAAFTGAILSGGAAAVTQTDTCAVTTT